MVESTNYNGATKKLKKDISDILELTWPSHTKEKKPSHNENFQVRSFYIYQDNQIISYAAVIETIIEVNGESYTIAGLSSVTTHPDYRKKGFGTEVVAKASQWIIENKKIDFGIFTAQPHLVPFYKKVSDWKVEPNMLVVGNHEKDALTSTKIGAVVLVKFLSKKACEQESLLKNATINLEFSSGGFL